MASSSAGARPLAPGQAQAPELAHGSPGLLVDVAHAELVAVVHPHENFELVGVGGNDDVAAKEEVGHPAILADGEGRHNRSLLSVARSSCLHCRLL
jgi:hypothetical protein